MSKQKKTLTSPTSIPRKLGTNSALKQRAELASRMGMQFGGKRDLYTVFGYNLFPTLEDYQAKYYRQNIARRVVDAPASATWRNSPTINFVGKVSGEKAFKKKWEELMLRYRLPAVFDKVDRLAGLGNYAILLLGFSDSTNFSTPVTKGEDTELLYTQPYSQKHVEILELETNASSSRFGLPTKYRIKLREPLQNVATGVSNVTTTFNYIDVHYSRVVHVAENAMDNNVIGTPRLEGVYNLLDDLEKVVGGTSETFWLASYKGMQIDVDKDMDMDAESEAALTDEIEEYQHQLRRFIRTRGVKVNDLGSSTPDPKNTFDVIISLISGTTGIPRRILLGSELGQLASDQDRANWSDRIKERRSTFAEPCVLIPFKQRMIEAGILPEMDLGTIEYIWPPNFQLTPLEEAQSQAQRARAIINLAKHFKEEPLCTKSEARSIVGLSPEIPADLPERTIDVKADSSADIKAPDSDSDSDSDSDIADDIDEPAINDTVE